MSSAGSLRHKIDWSNLTVQRNVLGVVWLSGVVFVAILLYLQVRAGSHSTDQIEELFTWLGKVVGANALVIITAWVAQPVLSKASGSRLLYFVALVFSVLYLCAVLFTVHDAIHVTGKMPDTMSALKESTSMLTFFQGIVAPFLGVYFIAPKKRR